MKKLLLIAIFAIILSGVNGCKQSKNADGKINVTTSIFPPYNFARQIAGDKVNLSVLLPRFDFA